VRIRVDAYPTEEFTGTVSQVRLQSTTVQNVVTYGTVIEVPNNALKLKPGMTANVVIEVAKKFNVLRVPNAAIRYLPSQDVFAELGQPVPPELQRGAMRAGGMGGFGQGSGGPFGAAPSPAASSATGGERPAGAGSMQRGPAAGGAVPSSLPRPSAGQQAQAGPGGMAGARPSERGGAQGQWQGGGPGGAGGPGGPGGRTSGLHTRTARKCDRRSCWTGTAAAACATRSGTAR
jgi:HlyD family secretion protein